MQLVQTFDRVSPKIGINYNTRSFRLCQKKNPNKKPISHARMISDRIEDKKSKQKKLARETLLNEFDRADGIRLCRGVVVKQQKCLANKYCNKMQPI